ncbi:MAG: LysM peptidoglycan-binding domain-containing protein [Caldilineaceae bacterium]
MDSFDQLDNLGPEDYLAEAMERLEAGEPLDAILSSYPADVRGELRDMLEVIDVIKYVASTPPPPVPASRRLAAKAQFLAVAAELRAQSPTPASINSSNHVAHPGHSLSPQDVVLAEVGQPIVEHHPGKPQQAGTDGAGKVARPDFWANLTQSINTGISSLFGFSSMRLAPIATLVVVMLLGSISVFNVAWSIPGDLTYPIKEWSRRVGLQLVPESEREAIREAQDKVRAQEVAQAIEKADRNSIVITETVTEIYHGEKNGSGLLTFGSVVVMPRYQPDANANTEFLPMAVEGQLVPGAEVELTYQIMPGQQGQSGIVQGISVQVLAAPAPMVAAPTNTAAPTATELPPPTVCRVSPPGGWVQYIVSANDTLGAIAVRSGVSTRYLAQVNCLVSANSIQTGMAIFVPETQAPAVAPTSTPADALASPALETPIITPTALTTVTVVGPGAGESTVVPTSTVVVTSTPLPDVSATLTSPVASTPVSGTQPAVTPTQIATATVEPPTGPTPTEDAPSTEPGGGEEMPTAATEVPPETPTPVESPPPESPTAEIPPETSTASPGEATIAPTAASPETATSEPTVPVREQTPITENGGGGVVAPGDTPVDGNSGQTATPEITPDNMTPVVITQSPTSTPTEVATIAPPPTQPVENPAPTQAPTTAPSATSAPANPILPPTNTPLPPAPTPIPPPPTPVPTVEQPPADSGG